ncbi:MAG: hypothetical protein ACKVOU_10820 [Cytophagales bacterium]
MQGLPYTNSVKVTPLFFRSILPPFKLPILYFTISILMFSFSKAVSQGVRVTIQVKSANDQYHVIPLKEKGVVVFYENKAISPGARTERWTFTKFDTTFTEEWTTEYPLLNNLNFINKFSDELFVYILFSKNKEFQIVKLDQETGEIFINKGRLPKENVEINHFSILGENAFMGGTIAPHDATLFYRTCLGFACFPLLFIPNFLPEKTVYIGHSSLQTKLNKQILLDLKGKSEVVNFNNDTLNGRLNAMVKNQTGKKSDLFIQELKYSGGKAQATSIKTFTDQYQLIDGKINCVDVNTKFVIGSYASKGFTGAQGLYLSKLENGKQEFINYQSFSKFKNFFDYLPKNEQEKLQKQIERKKSRGKDLDLSYQILVHKPILSDTNEFIIVAEAYFPQYHTEFRTSFYYGRPIETAVDVFDGWRYSHAIIAGMDKKGNLLWDNSIVIQDILTYALNEKIKILYNKNQYIAAYSQGGQIQYKMLSRDTAKTEKLRTFVEIDTDYERIKEQYTSDVEYWYGNFFIAYGAQKVKNLNTDYTKSTGTIIYFNKIELRQNQ